MLNESKNGLFKISQFEIEGPGIEKNSIGVSLIPNPGCEEAITLMNLAYAVMDCFDDWDINSRVLAPTIYFDLCTNNMKYRFKVEWELDIEYYLIQIANQFKL